MRVLQIIPTLDAGGAERTTCDIARKLILEGDEAWVLTEKGRLIGQLENMGAQVILAPVSTKNPIIILQNAWKISRLIKRNRIDLVHARSRAPAWSALLAARLTGCPFITTYHGAYNQTNPIKGFYNSIMARGNHVIANSEFTKALILSRHKVDQSKIEVIYRGVDLEDFDPENISPSQIVKLKQGWGIDRDDHVVLVAARLTSWKGQKDAIRALRVLKQKGWQNVKLILAGDPQGRMAYVDELNELIRDCDVVDQVKIVGHMTDIKTAYAAASCVLVPSIEPEAFGRTAAEAQAMGCPVIVTNIGAAVETVIAFGTQTQNTYTGWHIPPKDPMSCAEAIEKVLRLTQQEKDDLATRSRQHITKNFSLHVMCNATYGIYKKSVG